MSGTTWRKTTNGPFDPAFDLTRIAQRCPGSIFANDNTTKAADSAGRKGRPTR